MINKEKLLNVLKKHFPNYKDYKVIAELELAKNAIELVENFPEEPEIDFDALYDEYISSVQFDSTQSAWGFRDFLKSKNLTAPKPVEIPVKCPSCGCLSFKIDESMMCSACGAVFEPTRKLDIPVKRTWTLKKHVEEIFHDFGNTPYPRTSDPPWNLKKYYDLHEEPDYSKIPKGSIVEIEFVGSNGNNCGYVNGITNKSISIGFHMLYNSGNSTTINFDQIKSIVILKLAKE
jgi:ribosomal protein L37E